MDLNTILDDYKDCDATVCDDLRQVSYFNNTSKDVSVLHVNIRSVYKNFDHFLVFLKSTGVDFDVIVMSETHIIYNLDDFIIQGYLTFYIESSLTKFDGCLVYVKQQFFLNYSTVVVNDLKCALVSVSKNGVLFDILGTYRSPSTSVVDFLTNLNVILENNTKIKIKIIFNYISTNLQIS